MYFHIFAVMYIQSLRIPNYQLPIDYAFFWKLAIEMDRVLGEDDTHLCSKAAFWLVQLPDIFL